MTKDQIEQMLGEMGIPFRYHHFTQKEMQDIPLPIVVWLTPGTDNFSQMARHTKRSRNWILNSTQMTKTGSWRKSWRKSWTNMALPGNRRHLNGWSRRKCGSHYMKWRYRK